MQTSALSINFDKSVNFKFQMKADTESTQSISRAVGARVSDVEIDVALCEAKTPANDLHQKPPLVFQKYSCLSS